MLEKISKIWQPRRKRRAFDEVRRQIAACGYALDDLSDSELEALLTRGAGGGIEKFLPLTGKSIYWTLRRLAPDGRELRRRRIKQPLAPEAQKANYS